MSRRIACSLPISGLFTDQQGTVHNYDFDKLGRQTQDRVTALGSGVDNAVRRIATTYEVRGMKATISSHDNATVGSGSVLNQCQFVYNQFGQLVTEYQSHSGTVNVSTTPQVQYTFADGSDNTIRPTGMVYPNGRELTYAYGTAGSISDRSSRIASIIDDDETHLCDYQYLGRQTFVEQDDTEPQMKWTLIDLAGSNDPDTGDIYSGLDRFGRVKDNRWYNYDADEDVDRIQYGYDRASNRIWRKNVVAAALGKQFDELYTYDGIHRLKDMVRGTLNGGHTGLTSETFAESWTLDSTGNWRGFKQDDNGNGTWDLIQSRTANPVNEITDIAESVGPSWVTPAYSRAGNMTTMPQPADLTASYTATYDAWNRLVKVADGADTVSEYVYDGAKRRIVQKSYTSGTLDEIRHLYYTEPSKWQVVEERVGTSPDSADAERQFVWGLLYIDDLVVRDRDTDANGSLDERLYACQDANWNVTSVSDASASVQERYAYSSYGVPTFGTAVFLPSSSSTKDWETLYSGYRFLNNCGLFHIRHRGYHAMCGSWLSRDPAGYRDGVNLYAYCGSMPLSKSDPLGLICGVSAIRTSSKIKSSFIGIDAGHEWIKYGDNTVGFWPNRNWSVLRPDPCGNQGCKSCLEWTTGLRTLGTLAWGKGAGKKCTVCKTFPKLTMNVTCEEIVDCVDNAPDPGWEHVSAIYNCRAFVKWVFKHCCLEKDVKTDNGCDEKED